MKYAVMQPYIFPYIGYFQIIQVVDIFVFYDDVAYIKNGWINRNRILLNGKDHYLTVPCLKSSSYKLINEIDFDANRKDFKKLIKTIELSYKKAPYYNMAFPIIENVLKTSTKKISVLAKESVTQIADYLGIETQFRLSSIDFPETKGMDKADRLLAIGKKMNAEHYINVMGGKDLYNKTYFMEKEIVLNFINSQLIEYKQFDNDFIPWLSIIDVLMFNSKDKIKDMLTKYTLE